MTANMPGSARRPLQATDGGPAVREGSGTGENAGVMAAVMANLLADTLKNTMKMMVEKIEAEL
jgi:hypothetical protein